MIADRTILDNVSKECKFHLHLISSCTVSLNIMKTRLSVYSRLSNRPYKTGMRLDITESSHMKVVATSKGSKQLLILQLVSIVHW